MWSLFPGGKNNYLETKSIAIDDVISLYYLFKQGKIRRLTRKILVNISNLSSEGSLKLTKTILINAMKTKFFRGGKRLPRDLPILDHFDLFPRILPEIAVSIFPKKPKGDRRPS